MRVDYDPREPSRARPNVASRPSLPTSPAPSSPCICAAGGCLRSSPMSRSPWTCASAWRSAPTTARSASASRATASTPPTSPSSQAESNTSSRSCLIAPRRPRPRAHQARSHTHPQPPSQRRHPTLARRQRPPIPKLGKQPFDQLRIADLPGVRRVGEPEPHRPRGIPVHRWRTTRRPRPRRLATSPGRIAGPSLVAIAWAASCRRLWTPDGA